MSNSINYINPINKSLFSFDGQNIFKAEKSTKKVFIGSRLLYDDIISHSFKVDKNSSQENLNATVEIKMYEEAGLNLEKEYKIIFLEKELPFGNNLLIESFAIEKEGITKKYYSNIEKIKHIDFLALPFLVFESLYENQIIENKNDLFIHFGENESFIAFYKDGHFISTKSILSIKDFVNKIISQSDISINVKQLKEILLKKGLKKENYTLNEYDIFDQIQTIFSKMFTKVENILMHNRNIFGYTKIDRIYFNFDNYDIPGLKEFLENYSFDASLHKFDFLPDVHENILEFISALYIYDKCQKADNNQNITIFERKPSFFKTEAGKLFLITISSLLLFGTYPAYQQYRIYELEQEKVHLNAQYKTISAKAKKLKDKLKNSEQEFAKFNEKKMEIEKKMDKIENITDTLIDLKPENHKYTQLINTVNKYLRKYRLQTKQITQTGKNKIDIQIYSGIYKRDTIAKFMNDLLSIGFQSTKSNEIILNNNIYISNIEIEK